MGHDVGNLYLRFLLDLWHLEESGIDQLAAELAAPDLVIHQARRGEGASEAARGPRALAQLVRAGRAPFTDVNVSLDVGPIVDGDEAAGRWTFRGSYRSGIPGATAPEGTAVAFSGMDIVRAADGRIGEYWVCSEGEDLMAQLGAG